MSYYVTQAQAGVQSPFPRRRESFPGGIIREVALTFRQGFKAAFVVIVRFDC
jgi:hypothetical protein